MKYLQLFLWGLGSLFLTSDAKIVGEKQLSADSDREIIYQRGDFKCPFPFGAFPDPVDCEHFHVCVGGISKRMKCGKMKQFDALRRVCLPFIVAICFKDKAKSTTPVKDTKIDKAKSTTAVTETESTKTGDNFKCPKWMGTFPHPNDCSKYYTCVIYVSSLKVCPENQLFDDAKSSCKPESEVNCGNRQRPGFTTEIIVTEVSERSSPKEDVTESISTEQVITEAITEGSSTEEVTTDSITEAISTEQVTTETTTKVSSTTRFRPTGPPDHTCDEEDADCIITETRDIEDWFSCPQDVGFFPHPSSDRLFIFCMNWIPSAKKCGLNLVFSKESLTCIDF